MTGPRTLLTLTVALFLFASLLRTRPVLAVDLPVGPGESIQTAMDLAVDGDRILVEPGTHLELIDFGGKAIEVIGAGAGVTILDGDGGAPVVRFAGTEGVASVLRGFTVTGGAAALGSGGITATTPSTPTIEDCVIEFNTGKYGAGVSGRPVLRRCTIRNNTSSTVHGGGLYGAPQLFDCVVANNSCTIGFGGGVYVFGAPAVFENTVFQSNQTVFSGGRGGAIYVDSTGTGTTIDNCLIVENFCSAGAFGGALGGGVFVETSGTTIRQCTIVGNLLSAFNESGGGVYGPATIVNSIIRGNNAEQLVNVSSVSYCDVEGGWTGTGNFDLDPFFVAGPDGSYYLSQTAAGQASDSPCVDAGDPVSSADGTTRTDLQPDAGIVDIGYHFSVDATEPPFRRGDVNQDGAFDIADAVSTLSSLFTTGSPLPDCLDAGDANDDGAYDISDAIYSLATLFVPGSPPVPAPGSVDCGADPTSDGLGCDTFDACP